jgi:tetratricopeptide (TPR) repeat protein
MRALALILGVVVACWRLPARAEVTVLQAARTHSQAGVSLYEIGDFAAALREFNAAYHKLPLPEFLFNIGQCQLRLNQLTQAREAFVKFQEQVPADDPSREKVLRFIADIDRRLPPPSAVALAAPIEAAPEHKRPWVKQLAWIVPLSAVVVGAGVGLGVYFGTRSSGPDCRSAALGCVDWR